ncbi:MAG: hypothetical protein ACTSXA_06450 [Candidatus Heimdallarchaeota archaeon]
MIEWISFSLSLTALVMSTITAIVGLVITWINHQREFDPMIVLGLFKINNNSRDKTVRIKNLGRGSAFDVRVTIIDEILNEYRASSIDLIPANEYENIPFEYNRKNDQKYTELTDLVFLNTSLLYHISYMNENRRIKHTYYIAVLPQDWYTKITKRKFIKFKKKGFKI